MSRRNRYRNYNQNETSFADDEMELTMEDLPGHTFGVSDSEELVEVNVTDTEDSPKVKVSDFGKKRSKPVVPRKKLSDAAFDYIANGTIAAGYSFEEIQQAATDILEGRFYEN